VERVVFRRLHLARRRDRARQQRIITWRGHFPEILPERPRVRRPHADQVGGFPGAAAVGADLDSLDRLFAGPRHAKEPVRADATPYHPGTNSRSGKPWIGSSSSPFMRKANSVSSSIALASGKLRSKCIGAGWSGSVPTSAPSKRTSTALLPIPAFSSTRRSG